MKVYYNQVRGLISAYFGNVARDIHTRILEGMYGALTEDRQYPYLMPHVVWPFSGRPRSL